MIMNMSVPSGNFKASNGSTAQYYNAGGVLHLVIGMNLIVMLVMNKYLH